MPVSKAQQKATAKYALKAYDRIELQVYKGEKEPIKSHATTQNESLNAFINRAIKETIERDNATKKSSNSKAWENFLNDLEEIADDEPNKTENNHLKAWEDFYTNISACDEPLTEFERIKFKEIEI